MSAFHWPYTKAQKDEQFDNRVAIAKQHPDVVDFDNCSNVRLNGEIVAACVTREVASEHMARYRLATPRRGYIQIYRADRPIEKRPRTWRPDPLPRPWPLRVSDAVRAKAIAAVSADPLITCETIEE